VTNPFEPADRWRDALRRKLLAARKDRDALRAAVLRSALSAIDNAETPDGPVPSAGAIADSAVGLGSAEVRRRALDDDAIRNLLRAEIGERREAADQYAESGHTDRATALRDEAAVLDALLTDGP
jgi:uncharacterized protein YqeY